jgi:putative phosphoserine phosphatase/1-acylglycerol-3-phosphate O-acyltransferase
MVPLGLWGTEKVWPRSERLPRLWNVTNPPDVLVRLGDVVDLGYDDPDVDTRLIMDAIVELLPPEARERREPTPEELALTMPSSAKSAAGTVAHESARRPGSD